MNREGSVRCTVVRLKIGNFPGAVRRSVKGPVARCLKKRVPPLLSNCPDDPLEKRPIIRVRRKFRILPG